MDILEAPVIKSFIRLCKDGWEQGWHERNGGNLSYRLSEYDVKLLSDEFTKENEWESLKISAPLTAGQYYIVTGSGKYMRNVFLNPEDSICIVEIDDKGENYRVVWGLANGGKPTSELPTHILNSNEKLKTDPKTRVIYHAHTTSLIALTFVLPLTDREFTRALWKSATECPVVFPEGVGVVEWMVPGGSEIAIATAKLMAKHNAVIWAHHGIFCAGKDFDETFGLMHTIEKAADIYIRALSCNMGIRQTISDDGIRAIAKEFNIEINTEYLD